MPAPRKLDREEAVKTICSRLMDGVPLAVICRELGISTRSVSYWRKEDGEVAASIDEAFKVGIDMIAHRSRLTARGKKEKEGGESTGDIDRDKMIIWHDLKLLAIWDSRYRETKVIAGDPENPIIAPAQLTEAQLLAIAAQGVKSDG